MKDIKKYTIGVITILFSFLMVFLKGKKAGKRIEKNKQRKVIEKNVRKAKKAHDNITDVDRNRMRKKYRR